MATARTATLEELTKLATYFVTKQKGLRDHIAWMDFLSSVQHKARNCPSTSCANSTISSGLTAGSTAF